MKIFIAVLLLNLWLSAAFAQSIPITLNGFIGMATGEKFPYKLMLTESGGKVKGVSYTCPGPDETKALVTGVPDRHTRTLVFKETEIVSAHGYHTKAFMCLVDAHLQYVPGGSGYILTGDANNTETDKTSCTPGTITFSNTDEIENLFSYHDQYDTMISMKKRARKPNDAPAHVKATVLAPPLITDKITSGIEKSYDWHTDTVIIDVWDGGIVDGDRITLTFNGKRYLTNYFLVREKRELRLPVSGTGSNTITIFADNEGSDPPNTADLLLTDGTKQYSILAYNLKGQQAVVRIKKVK